MRTVELGKIVKPHGFRGAVKVRSHGGKDSALSYLSQVYVQTSDRVDCYKIVDRAWMPKGWKIHLDTIRTEEAAENLRDATLLAAREDLLPPGVNEYYIEDLQGATVVDSESRKPVGTFVGVHTSSGEVSQDIWNIEIEGRPLLVPACSQYIASIDTHSKKIYVKNLSDLLEAR